MLPVGVELKSLRDLLSSIRSGRLAGRQLPGMVVQYSFCYLVIEGVWRADASTGLLVELFRGGWREVKLGSQRFFWRDVESMLTSLDTLTPVRIRRTRSRTETVQTLESLYRWWQKPWEEHGTLKVLYSPAAQTLFPLSHPLVRRVAAQLPGVGWERSAAVAESFCSVAEMSAADEKRWRKVPGIGRVLARRIASALQGVEP